jgi:hypothetical protein
MIAVVVLEGFLLRRGMFRMGVSGCSWWKRVGCGLRGGCEMEEVCAVIKGGGEKAEWTRDRWVEGIRSMSRD